MRNRRNQIGDKDCRSTLRLEADDLMVHRVATGPSDADARQHIPVLLDEIDTSGFDERYVVFREVACAISFV